MIDPAGPTLPLEGLVHRAGAGLSVSVVRCRRSGAVQREQRLVPLHPGQQAGHHVLQWESGRKLGQLREPGGVPGEVTAGAGSD